MSTAIMIATMSSVFLGFAFFTGAFASYSYGKPGKLTWSLFAIAVLLITVIPVVLAISVAV
ncbi:hypothetical protein [Corynebacterium silvaticum]|uniref:Secreted protein n=1 Tax=Corynebacterium silvaticum TaxID=2320431 RepID=A0A7Y4LIL3_9CORY|nr:hypothetical protein [Corynebacterium silvaticum]ARU46968.1 hypothetical protein CBE74_11545 [Corynebacterium silvaticum]MBH5300922.1 hypothetical protein [Corynebacterium silvaticum]NOM65120.1 hypothetical protein [Corynebacterium silvaticum]NON70751.1 hypothetical protein [Corynebacterium silvaticum]TFA92862.1 hypothetical protein EU802_06000 [Corynebacterium silvaticum]